MRYQPFYVHKSFSQKCLTNRDWEFGSGFGQNIFQLYAFRKMKNIGKGNSFFNHAAE